MHGRYSNGVVNIPTELLRTLVVISDCSSFTKAAERLHVTQSAVSAQVKRLQQIVGDELFDKVGASQILNERGVAVSKIARRILGMNDQILAMSGWLGRANMLRVGVPAAFGGEFLGKLMGAFKEERVTQSVHFYSDKSNELLKSLQAGYIDLAFLFSAQGAGVVPVAEWDEELEWVCSRDFVLSLGAPIPIVINQSTEASRFAQDAMEDHNKNYIVAFSGIDQANCLAAVRAGAGFMVAGKSYNHADLKASKDYFLPPLPNMTCGLYAYEGLESKTAEDVISKLLKVGRPSPKLPVPTLDSTSLEARRIRARPT